MKTDYKKGNHKVFWEDPQEVKGSRLKFDGVPFMILGTKIFDCLHGTDRKVAAKRKYTQTVQVLLRFGAGLSLFRMVITVHQRRDVFFYKTATASCAVGHEGNC